MTFLVLRIRGGLSYELVLLWDLVQFLHFLNGKILLSVEVFVYSCIGGGFP